MVVPGIDSLKLNEKLKDYEHDFVIVYTKENLNMAHYMNEHCSQTI